MQESYDFIIVGGGSAGCLLANRLSADDSARVLMLEAGPSDRDPFIHIPLGLGHMHARRSHDWGYDAEPLPQLNGRALEMMRGKVLGGSSAINHMAHVRGNRGDYDRWARNGLAQWSYAHVLPYFRRYERWQGGANLYRGGSGPLPVTLAQTRDPLFDACIAAGAAVGIPYTSDYNGSRQEGIGRGQFTISSGRRQSSAVAFLRPVLNRRNLTVHTGAHATKILMQGTRATGIQYLHRGRPREAHADTEVVLTCGTFNTPHLLMLSGIGPADELAAHGIKPIVDLKGVGQNLQDHMAVVVSAHRPVPGPFRREMRLDRMPINLLRAYVFGSGPATYLPGGLHGFVKTHSSLDAPDIQLLFRGVPGRPYLWFPGLRKPYEDQCGVRPVLLHPKSRGELRLPSANPLDKIRILSNVLREEADVRDLRSGIDLSRDIMAQPALRDFRGSETAPGPKAKDGKALDDWIRRTAVAVHHPCGTCAMGTGDAAVLDEQLRVRGVEKLRIADASAMPDLVSGNINACVLMIAETASDLLLGKKRLPPVLPSQWDEKPVTRG